VLPTVMTTEEVAALLRVNRKAIYGAVARGELPGAHRVGRKLRFARDAVLAWLVGHRAIAEAR
jgi:excisionase family DNA binding protein